MKTLSLPEEKIKSIINRWKTQHENSIAKIAQQEGVTIHKAHKAVDMYIEKRITL